MAVPSKAPMRRLLFRPLWLALATAALVLLVAILLIAGMTWRTLGHLRQVERHAAHAQLLQRTGLDLQHALVDELSGGTQVDRPRLAQLYQEIEVLEGWNMSLARETPVRLVEIRRLLVDGGQPPRAALVAALDVYRRVLAAESQAQEELLASVYSDARLELGLAGGGLAALAALTGLGLFLFRRRLFTPLADLGRLLSSLAGGERREIDARDSEPLLGPLFENYNALVHRLGELEASHRARTRSLENEVETATRELLRQRQSLVRAELLAAVGETAASLAHELRNPLAGIRMSLSNLRRETGDADHRERLQRAGEELRRVGRTVDRLLDAARHTPEGRRRVRLGAVVGELAALLRHQLPADVTLAVDVADDLHASLPEDGFRQALLNLILNATQAFAGAPGTIEVTARRRGEDLEVTVADDGPGFSDELLRSGIRPFSTERLGGTGLGLAVVRRFATDLGGEVHLDNREPRGARVTLRLPAGEP